MWVTFIVFTAMLWLYAAWRWIHPLPIHRGLRWLYAALLLLVAEQMTLVHLVCGQAPAQVLPRNVLIIMSWAFGSFLLLVLALVVRDVVGCLIWLVRRRKGRRVLGSIRIPLVLGLLAALLGAWGTWQGLKVPAVKTVDVHLAGLPAAFDGYRIVQLSDVHATRLLPRWWVAAVVAKVNAQHPDLVVLTGDLEDGMPQVRLHDVQPLSDLRAADGVLAVPGNHEYYSSYEGWMAAFQSLGLTMLQNSHVLIEHQGQTLAVAGLTDRAALRTGLPGPDLARAITGIPTGTPLIVLSHRPDTARAIARSGALLELAGHTHGGQIIGLGWMARRANNGFLSGLYRVGGMQLYVSNGTGLWAGLAMRIGRPSEITRIILHAEP